MKKFFLILFILLALIIAGAAVFIATLDLDSFRPQIVERIENVIKKPVTLDRLELGWQSGIALELQGFSILENENNSEALLKVGTAKAVLELAPLLSRKIQVAAIYLDRPSIRLIKRKDGTFEGLEPAAGETGQQRSATIPKEAAALPFLVNTLRISDGEVFYKDISGSEPVEMNVRKIDITVNDIALDRPIEIKGKASVFSGSQNFDLKGKLTVSSKEKTAALNGLHAELQLGSVDLKEIAKISPAVQDSGIIPPVEGTLTVDVDSLALNEQGLKNISAEITLAGGKVRQEALPGPVENISVETLATMKAIDIRKFAVNVAGGGVQGTAKTLLTGASGPVTTFDLKAANIKVEELMKASRPADPKFSGILSLTANGQLAGSDPERIKQTLNAQGTVVVEQAMITNKNLLREVFEKFSMIPGLVERLMERLPENYKEKLNAKGTKMGTVQVPFSVTGGTASFPKIDVATDSFRITGSGTYGLARGMVTGNAVILIEQELSAAMTGSVEELRYLMNSRKEIQIPLSFRGIAPRITVTPDLQYITSQLAAQEAAKVAGKYIRKAIGVKESPEGGSTQTGSGGILDDLLREGLKKIGSKQ